MLKKMLLASYLCEQNCVLLRIKLCLLDDFYMTTPLN